jgi:hypothetical protein
MGSLVQLSATTVTDGRPGGWGSIFELVTEGGLREPGSARHAFPAH